MADMGETKVVGYVARGKDPEGKPDYEPFSDLAFRMKEIPSHLRKFTDGYGRGYPKIGQGLRFKGSGDDLLIHREDGRVFRDRWEAFQAKTLRWVVATTLDQTIGYVTEDGSLTTRPSQAKLFETYGSASLAAGEPMDDPDPQYTIEPIVDVDGFWAQEPTWEDRPLTREALFDLAVVAYRATSNQLMADGMTPKELEAVDHLFCSALDVVQAFGHHDPNHAGEWVYGEPVRPGEVSP